MGCLFGVKASEYRYFGAKGRLFDILPFNEERFGVVSLVSLLFYHFDGLI